MRSEIVWRTLLGFVGNNLVARFLPKQKATPVREAQDLRHGRSCKAAQILEPLFGSKCDR